MGFAAAGGLGGASALAVGSLRPEQALGAVADEVGAAGSVEGLLHQGGAWSGRLPLEQGPLHGLLVGGLGGMYTGSKVRGVQAV